MGELIAGSGAIIKELGILAFMIFAAVAASAFLIYRITVTQDRITALLDKLFASSDLHCQQLAVHDRQGQGIADDVREIKTIVTRIDGRIKQ